MPITVRARDLRIDDVIIERGNHYRVLKVGTPYHTRLIDGTISPHWTMAIRLRGIEDDAPVMGEVCGADCELRIAMPLDPIPLPR